MSEVVKGGEHYPAVVHIMLYLVIHLMFLGQSYWVNISSRVMTTFVR